MGDTALATLTQEAMALPYEERSRNFCILLRFLSAIVMSLRRNLSVFSIGWRCLKNTQAAWEDCGQTTTP